jgi:hypothetical protein
MNDALDLRDRWFGRLLRTSSWSPLCRADEHRQSSTPRSRPGRKPGGRQTPAVVDTGSLLSIAAVLGAARIRVAAALMNPVLTPSGLRVLREHVGCADVGVAGEAYADRLEPAAASVDGYATRDVELDDAHIQRGDLVVASLAGANRGPSIFTEPDRFDVYRADARLKLACVQGPHFRLGAQLARTETTMAVARLPDRLAGLAPRR